VHQLSCTKFYDSGKSVAAAVVAAKVVKAWIKSGDLIVYYISV